VAEDLPEETAGALCRELREIGVLARPVDAGSWPALPAGYKASALEFLEDSLLARLPLGESLVIPREDILGVHLYGLPPDSPREEPSGSSKRDELQTGRRGAKGTERFAAASRGMVDPLDPLDPLDPGGAGGLSPRGRRLLENLKEHDAAAMTFHLTFHCAEPFGPVRVRKNEFDFSSLGAQKEEHSLDNFLALLERVIEFLPEAWGIHKARGFLADLEPRRILYFKPEEAENVDRWMLRWVWIKKEEAAQEGAHPPRREGAP
jgi:hypothetical protein